MAKKKRSRKGGRYVEPAEHTVEFRSRIKRPHVAEEYLASGRPEIAHELVRHLKRQQQVAVVGHIKLQEVT